MGIDRDEPLNKVIAFGKSTGVTYPLGLDPGLIFSPNMRCAKQVLPVMY